MLYKDVKRIYKSIDGLYRIEDAEGRDMLNYGPIIETENGPEKYYCLGSEIQTKGSHESLLYIYYKMMSNTYHIPRKYRDCPISTPFIPTKPFKIIFDWDCILSLLPLSSLDNTYDLDDGDILTRGWGNRIKFRGNYLLDFDVYLRYFIDKKLDDKTIQDYVRDFMLHKDDLQFTKCPRRYIDPFKALFIKGIPLDFMHPIEGDGLKYIYHLKDEDDTTLSRNVCRFFAHLFGLEYGSKVYLYHKVRDGRFSSRRYKKNPELWAYLKFDGSGLDFSNFFIFNLMLYLRFVKGLKGIELIRAMGYSRWVHGNRCYYSYQDYPIRNIRGGWID